jgi:hypothetical protein
MYNSAKEGRFGPALRFLGRYLGLIATLALAVVAIAHPAFAQYNSSSSSSTFSSVGSNLSSSNPFTTYFCPVITSLKGTIAYVFEVGAAIIGIGGALFGGEFGRMFQVVMVILAGIAVILFIISFVPSPTECSTSTTGMLLQHVVLAFR